MELFLIACLLLINFGISWWDAKAAGVAWREAKAEGGFMSLVVWSAAVQSACGFTMVSAALLAGMASALHLMKASALGAATDLVSLLVIVPLVGSGLVITIHSYIAACQERSLVSTGVAAWNTFAMFNDIADAIEGICDAFSDLVSFVDDDADGVSLAGVIAVVLLASGGGITLTYAIARSNLHKSSVRTLKATRS